MADEHKYFVVIIERNEKYQNQKNQEESVFLMSPPLKKTEIENYVQKLCEPGSFNLTLNFDKRTTYPLKMSSEDYNIKYGRRCFVSSKEVSTFIEENDKPSPEESGYHTFGRN